MTSKDYITKQDMPSKDSPQSTPKAKGERLRRIRNMANLSREDFCARSGVTLATLISWEVGRFGGLSAKGAKRVVAFVAQEGVICSVEWLLYEVGSGPEVKANYYKISKVEEATEVERTFDEENQIMIEELMLFRKLNRSSIDLIVEDGSMQPYYNVGDFVAGIKRRGEKIKTLLGMDCIVQTKDGSLLLRTLQTGPREGSYNLVCKNAYWLGKDSLSYDVEVVSAAPIIWHRRKNPIF